MRDLENLLSPLVSPPIELLIIAFIQVDNSAMSSRDRIQIT